ncbi:MAG TPA: hypothetical protein IAB10_03015 [Candidatus Avilachnospira avistercoris]|nr:hypothetical protein [Candidatus Avilachnospira avistercoris]
MLFKLTAELNFLEKDTNTLKSKINNLNKPQNYSIILEKDANTLKSKKQITVMILESAAAA